MVTGVPDAAGTADRKVPGLATLHVVPAVPMLRPAETVFEKILEGFVEHQRARNLQRDTISDRVRTVRQLQAFAGAYPWEPAWNHRLFDKWSGMLADTVAPTTVRGKQLQLKNFLDYFTSTAYEWPQVCVELFGTFPAQVARDLNMVRHSQQYAGRPGRNRPLSREETRRFFGQFDPEIGRLRASSLKGTLSAARDLALFVTIYGWGLRRREAARLETHDWRRHAKLAEFGDLAGLSVRWGKATAGQPPRRRVVVSVWPWAVTTVGYYLEHVRPLFYVDREDDGVMFPTERDEMISVRSVNDRFAHWRDLAELPTVLCTHCLRHSYITRLIEDGYDPQFVTDTARAWTSVGSCSKTRCRATATLGRVSARASCVAGVPCSSGRKGSSFMTASCWRHARAMRCHHVPVAAAVLVVHLWGMGCTIELDIPAVEVWW